MNKVEKDAYWMELIQQCRISGLSDYMWCKQNGVSISSFYYHVKRLREKAASIPTSIPKVLEKPEIVPIHYNELQEQKLIHPKHVDEVMAVRLEFHGVVMSITNEADTSIITATLKALQQLC